MPRVKPHIGYYTLVKGTAFMQEGQRLKQQG